MLKENMKSIYWKLYSSIPFCYPYIVRRELEGCKSILDIGCGPFPLVGKIGLNPDYCVGVEVVPERAEKAKNNLNHVITSNIRDIEFSGDSFDGLVAIDLIEHFEKSEALSLISNMKKWARKKVIIITPNTKLAGFVDSDLPVNLKEYQKHKCVFSAEELKDLGFRVYGIRGIKCVNPNLRKKIPVLRIISLLTQPVVKNRTGLASGLLGMLEI